jgi:hypothetical protein
MILAAKNCCTDKAVHAGAMSWSINRSQFCHCSDTFGGLAPSDVAKLPGGNAA